MSTENTDSGRYVDRNQVYSMYLDAVGHNDGHYYAPLSSAGAVLGKYLNDEDRAKFNTRVWRGDLPATSPELNTIRTPEQAVGKIVWDAEFYAQGNWEVVCEVARRSIYTDY
jgi:hypothetical protein